MNLLTLPKSVEIQGVRYPIRYDFRVILDIITMLNDADLSNQEKCLALLDMFYIDKGFTDYNTAVKECYEFISYGINSKDKSASRLIDWEKDIQYIISPVNRVLGADVRGFEYDEERNEGGLHWWTFLSAYMEIGGDCLLSQIVSIRDKLARHKQLEKHEKEWYSRNRDLVDIKIKYSDAETDLLSEWTGGK